jgi:hypothetical protein
MPRRSLAASVCQSSSTTMIAMCCDALFASPMQRSDLPTLPEVRHAIVRAPQEYGGRGCAARMAHEFGEHPETAASRMRWARLLVAEAFDTERAPATTTKVRHLRQPSPAG